MLQVFSFESTEIHCYGTWDKPIWIAQEICNCLELQGDAGQHTRRLDEDEKGLISIQTPGGAQEVLGINEPGLYALVLGCRKPIAKRFKRWITHEVLPSIRKTGSYSLPQPRQIEPLKREQQLDALKMLFTLNERLPDDRTTITLKAHLTNLVEASQQSEPVPPMLTVTEVLEMEGIPIPSGKDSVLGRKVAKAFREAYGTEPTATAKHIGTGHRTANIKLYPQEFFERIVMIASEYFA